MSDLTVKILQQIRDKLDETNARLDQTNARLDQTNARLDQTNARLEENVSETRAIGARLEENIAETRAIGTRLDETNRKVDHLAGSFVTVVSLLGGIHDRLDSHDRLADRVQRCERDIETLKQRVG